MAEQRFGIFGKDVTRYIPPELRPFAKAAIEMNPVTGFQRAGQALKEGKYGESAVETGILALPAGAYALRNVIKPSVTAGVDALKELFLLGAADDVVKKAPVKEGVSRRDVLAGMGATVLVPPVLKEAGELLPAAKVGKVAKTVLKGGPLAQARALDSDISRIFVNSIRPNRNITKPLRAAELKEQDIKTIEMNKILHNFMKDKSYDDLMKMDKEDLIELSNIKYKSHHTVSDGIDDAAYRAKFGASAGDPLRSERNGPLLDRVFKDSGLAPGSSYAGPKNYEGPPPLGYRPEAYPNIKQKPRTEYEYDFLGVDTTKGLEELNLDIPSSIIPKMFPSGTAAKTSSLFSPESKQGRQLLIVSCSDKKCPDVGDMKALDRYTGQLFSKMKAFGIPPKVDVAILSAKHGLIRSDTPIENYDQIMTDEIRDKFLKDPNELKKIRDTMSGDYDKVIVTGGPNYRSIIDAAAKDINYEVVSEKAPGLTQEAVVQRLRRKKFEKEIALQKQFEGPENFEKDITAYHYTFPGQGKFNTSDIKKFDMDVVQARNKGYSVKYADTLGLHVGSENAAKDRFLNYTDLDAETIGKDPEKLAPGATYPLKVDTRKPFLNPNSEDGLWGEIELENFLYEEFLKDPKFKDIIEDNMSGGAFTYPVGAQTERARELTKQIRKKLAKDGFTNIPYKNDIEGGVRGRYGGIEQKEISHIMLIDRPNPKSKVVKSKITAEPMEEGGVAGLSDIARDMFKGPKGIGAYQPFMVG